MKFKKVLASAMAAAMALTTMVTTSFTASAANVLYSFTATESSTGTPYEGDFLNYVSAEQAAEIATVTFNFDVSGAWAYAKVGIGYNKSVDPWWGQTDVVELSTSDDVVNANDTVSFAVSDVRNSGDGAGYFKLAFDWVNAGTTVTISDFDLLDANGKSLLVEEEAPPVEDEPIVPTSSVIWEGSTAMTTGASDHGWDGNVQIDAAKITSEGTITVTMTDVAQGAQYGIRDGSWNKLLDYSEEMAAGTASFTYTITASDLEAITSTGALIIAGHDFTVTKVEFAAASSDGNSSGKPGEIDPEAPKPEEPAVIVVPNVIPVITVSVVPANSAKKFEITDSVTGKVISASVNKLAKSLSKLTEGSELAFDTGAFGLVLRKNAVKEIVDNDLTLTIKTSKATFIIDADNLAKVKTINIPAIMKTAEFKKLLKEGNTFNVIVTEKNKVEIELA
ncbi:MAG: hypothetical protein IKK42_09300 [Oscillospiraceae bacterium]|nr:hypothetical protein [Oscillospiraceae bacterium]